MNEEIRVLIIDDDSEDYLLTKHYLNSIMSVAFLVDWESDYSKALNRVLEQKHDVYLVDFNLGGKNGVDLVSQLVNSGINAPFIFLTGMNNYSIDIQAMQAGAVDYLIKGKINEEQLERSIRYAIKQKKIENQLIDSNNTKTKLFSIISHDLRSPFISLMNILELTESFKTEMNSEIFDSLLNQIKNDSKATFDLLQNILNWAQNEIDAIIYRPDIHFIKPIIITICEQMQPLANSKKIRIGINVPDSASAYFDKQMILLIFRNLISNAVKFTPNDGTINISVYAETDKILISIKDSGVGMQDEIVKKIFKKDVYFTTKGTNNEKGTGLGLKLCSEFARKNKGNIWVESILGLGTTFSFSLPLTPNYVESKNHELEIKIENTVNKNVAN